MFFAVQPPKAILSDLNPDLVVTFKKVKNNYRRLNEQLRALPANKDRYYELRGWKPENDFERALRFIYLNRNCFGGIYRENKKGEFNVPYGGGTRSHVNICRDGTLDEAAKVLKQSKTKINCKDFEKIMARAQEGDFIYCDPTYLELSKRTFDRYGKKVFSKKDQVRLRNACISAYNKGVFVIISSSNWRCCIKNLDMAILY